MSTAVLSPVQTGETVDLAGRLFRKQILPVGSINYKGRRITFDKQYLTDLADAFRERAFDQVAFQLADADNRHTMDPTRFGGEVRGVEVTDDGLYGTLELTPETADLVRKNPRLGVSARIVEGLEHSDGRKFNRAMLHVLGTLDPNVTGMKAWEEVNLSNEVDETLDLTNAAYEADDDDEGVEVEPNSNGLLDADDLDFIQSIVAQQGNGDNNSESRQQTVGLSNDRTDSNTGSTEQREDLEFARVREQERETRIATLEQQLADSRFETEKQALLDAGVPPAMVELARPVLTMPHTPVIDLTRGDGTEEEIDLAQVVRGLLKEARGTVDLNREVGVGGDDVETDPVKREDVLLDAWPE